MQKKHKRDLLFLLSSDGHNEILAPLIDQLLQEISHVAPFFPEEGTLDLEKWDKVGLVLSKSDRPSVQILHTWKLCRSAIARVANPLFQLQDASSASPRILPPSQPPGLGGDFVSKAASAPPAPLPSASSLLPGSGLEVMPPSYSVGSPSEIPQTAVQQMVSQALKEGDGEAILDALPLMALCPIARNAQGHRVHEPLSLIAFKELKKSVTENGLHSTYTTGLLDGLRGGNNLIPNDWRALIKALLTPAQYVLFVQEWKDAAAQMAMNNLQNNVGISVDMLTGEGTFSTIAQQITMPNAAVDQLGHLIKEAWHRVPEVGTPAGSFATIQQGATEDYMSFVNRLQRALERQVVNPEAAGVLLKQLAFENANQDCKTALKAIYQKPETDIAHMLKLCQNIGTESHKTGLLAAALAPLRHPGNNNNNGSREKRCFGCNRVGHFLKDCRVSKPENGSRPPFRCKKCGKGYHWASQCRSQTAGNSQAGVLPARG